MDSMKQFDFTIIGGGMVGSATAIGLAKQGWKVAVIEAQLPQPFSPEQPVDLRVSAISAGSVKLLGELGAWEGILDRRCCPYKRLATWESDGCQIEFSAEQLALDSLGYMVENRVVQLALLEQFEHYPEIELFSGEYLDRLTPQNTEGDAAATLVALSNGTTLSTKTIIGADGANSKVRQLSNIGITAWDYRQHCMLIHVETQLPQQDITWQWFTPTGPRSLLPLNGQQASLVWYDAPATIRALSKMSNSQLEEEIHRAFPAKLGQVKVLNQGSFPLTRRHANHYFVGHTVLVGDAAHTINPLAGQGVNLGFKDVMGLVESVAKEGNNTDAFKRYHRIRYPDNLLMQTSMDLFYKGFSNDLAGLKFARNAVLKLADRSGVLKEKALKYALGL
jgi:2-octaprenyl-3-methyl-6-methoxy-1,4-benzoquinol hydroxylase